jgi:dTDP-4-dehydrorhamnose reductase
VRALITGGGGQLASDLADQLGSSARAYSHSELDITERSALDKAFEECAPEIVFNCAAFHNVDACEREAEQAWRVNVEAVRDLARRGVPLVHISTNYVFDGRRPKPYREYDLPAPRSVYAVTKLAGEHCALAYGRYSLVVRSAGLYGLHGSTSKGGNFVQRMIARARETSEIRMVADQLLQPTYTADLAAAIIAAVEKGAHGIVHLTAGRSCSWFQFTQAILELAGIEVALEPISTTVPVGGADRPLNGVLARPNADKYGLPRLRDWREALADYMQSATLIADAARGK